jgi:UrcA family protein
MTRLFQSLVVFSLPLAALSPAQAGGLPSTSVSVAGLDLSTSEGQRELERRVERAAALLCDTANERLAPAVRKAQRECRETTVAAAMGKRAPLLVAAR